MEDFREAQDMEECEGCGSSDLEELIDVERKRHRGAGGDFDPEDTVSMCRFCYSSAGSSLALYPEQYGEHALLISTINQGFNTLLAILREKEAPE